MAITKIQSVTGTGASLVLNGVAAGNMLSFQQSYFRTVSTGLAPATPVDSNGTFAVPSHGADVPLANGSADGGSACWYEQNAAAGTHTVNPSSNINSHSSTLT